MDFTTTLMQWQGLLVVESAFSAVVFAVVAGLTWLLRRRSPALHVALWSLVFIRLVLPPGLAHPLSAGSLVGALARPHAESMLPFDEGGSERGSVAGPASPISGHSARWMAVPTNTVLAVLWLVGFAGVTGGYLRRLGAVRRILAAAVPADDPFVTTVVERWRRRLGVRRNVRIVTSTAGVTPFTVGIMRPIIYLPAELMGEARCVEAAVAHEMGHVVRLDALWLGLQQIVQTIYFFNPLVWFSGARLNDARESLCDATIVAAGGLAARDYAGGLLHVLRLDLQGAGAP